MHDASILAAKHNIRGQRLYLKVGQEPCNIQVGFLQHPKRNMRNDDKTKYHSHSYITSLFNFFYTFFC